MSDIIGIIATIEDDSYQGKAHKKVTLEDGQVLKVKYGREGALKAKWDLLQEGTAIKFTMRDFTTPEQVKIPFVADIETVDSALPEAQEPAPLLEEHQKEVDKASEAFDRDYFDTHKDRDGLPLSVKIRTFCVSYAKDIAVAKMGVGGEEMSALKVLQIAEIFASYIANGVIVEKKGD